MPTKSSPSRGLTRRSRSAHRRAPRWSEAPTSWRRSASPPNPPTASRQGLAHCAMALIGEGQVDCRDGARRHAADALAGAGLEPTTLGPKEGLALINGTDGILAMLILAAADLEQLVRVADIAAAMSVEALL